MAENTKKALTIFMYPWFAMGHIIPYILTANKLAKRGHKIIIIIPTKSQSKFTSLNLYSNSIQFIPISIPQIDGLLIHAETTNDIPIHDSHLLLRALDLTRPTIESMLCEIKPDFVFFDHLTWLPGLARTLKIKSVRYSVISAASMCFLFAEGPTIEDLVNGPPGLPPTIKLPKYAGKDLKFLNTCTVHDSGGITMRQQLVNTVTESDALGFKTCKEIEGPYCEFLEKTLNKKVLLAGPIVPTTHILNDEDKIWVNWLDKFTPRKVIYCAFGSEAILKIDQFQQLLLGIELTGFPFLIALKSPFGIETIEQALPEGFTERTRERGIVHGGWVPQQIILKHPSVGGFVTHCGYGSMWEGLMSECQLVVLPHIADQNVNARLLSSCLKVAVAVEKGEEDGLFTKESACLAIMAAMEKDSEIGKDVKDNHDKLRNLMLREGFEDSYFDGFVENLRSLLE